MFALTANIKGPCNIYAPCFHKILVLNGLAEEVFYSDIIFKHLVKKAQVKILKKKTLQS